MSLNMDNLEMIYKQLFEISSQVGQLIERELYNELNTYLEKKDSLLAQADVLLQKIIANGEDASHLNELAEKIKAQEKANLEALSSARNEVRTELNKTSKDKKLTGAYATQTESQGSILDFSE